MAAPFVGHLMLEQTMREEASGQENLLQQWIKAARAGDAAAFEQIIVLHERRILSLCLRLLMDREDAKDAAQEVFLRLHRNLNRFRDGHDLSPWLYRIAINICHDLRRKRTTAGMTAGDPPKEPLDQMPNPEQAAAAGQQHVLLLTALDTLTGRERDAITLRDLEGLCTAEVAGALGMSEATVRSHISHGRMKMRNFMLNQGRESKNS